MTVKEHRATWVIIQIAGKRDIEAKTKRNSFDIYAKRKRYLSCWIKTCEV